MAALKGGAMDEQLVVLREERLVSGQLVLVQAGVDSVADEIEFSAKSESVGLVRLTVAEAGTNGKTKKQLELVCREFVDRMRLRRIVPLCSDGAQWEITFARTHDAVAPPAAAESYPEEELVLRRYQAIGGEEYLLSAWDT